MCFDKLIYSGWQTPVRVVVVGTSAYVALLVLLRVSGKRTLSKMNAFDSIVTIALGSTLASALITRDVAFVQAVTAFALLIGLQLIVTWLSVRFETVDRLVKAEPTLLLYRGRLLSDLLRRERVTVKARQDVDSLTTHTIRADVICSVSARPAPPGTKVTCC